MNGWRTYTAFAGNQQIATGDVRSVVLEVKAHLDRGETRPILTFEDQTGDQIDFDLRGSPQQALERLASHPLFSTGAARGQLRLGPGRPKLGVVCREVSLLPRHWTWLDEQPGGMSSTLRRLVDEARTRTDGGQLARAARDAAGKFMWGMAGNLPNFEEASRALFAGDRRRLKTMIRNWPPDIRKHIEQLLRESEQLEKQASASIPQ